MYKLLKPYLTKRKQLVNFVGYESDWYRSRSATGSVLGPLLFLVYINNLQNNTSLKVLNLADDTLLLYTFRKYNYKTDTAYI